MKCDHEFVDATNTDRGGPVVSGFVCPKCGALSVDGVTAIGCQTMAKTTEEMASEAGLQIFQTHSDPPIPWVDGSVHQLEKFAALVRAEERQKCVDAVRAWGGEFGNDEPTARWLKVTADRLENPGMRP